MDLTLLSDMVTSAAGVPHVGVWMNERENGVKHGSSRSMIAYEAREIIGCGSSYALGYLEGCQEIAVLCRRDAVMHLSMSEASISILLSWTSAAPQLCRLHNGLESVRFIHSCDSQFQIAALHIGSRYELFPVPMVNCDNDEVAGKGKTDWKHDNNTFPLDAVIPFCGQ